MFPSDFFGSLKLFRQLFQIRNPELGFAAHHHKKEQRERDQHKNRQYAISAADGDPVRNICLSGSEKECHNHRRYSPVNCWKVFRILLPSACCSVVNWPKVAVIRYTLIQKSRTAWMSGKRSGDGSKKTASIASMFPQAVCSTGNRIFPSVPVIRCLTPAR